MKTEEKRPKYVNYVNKICISAIATIVIILFPLEVFSSWYVTHSLKQSLSTNKYIIYKRNLHFKKLSEKDGIYVANILKRLENKSGNCAYPSIKPSNSFIVIVQKRKRYCTYLIEKDLAINDNDYILFYFGCSKEENVNIIKIKYPLKCQRVQVYEY